MINSKLEINLGTLSRESRKIVVSVQFLSNFQPRIKLKDVVKVNITKQGQLAAFKDINVELQIFF